MQISHYRKLCLSLKENPQHNSLLTRWQPYIKAPSPLQLPSFCTDTDLVSLSPCWQPCQGSRQSRWPCPPEDLNPEGAPFVQTNNSSKTKEKRAGAVKEVVENNSNFTVVGKRGGGIINQIPIKHIGILSQFPILVWPVGDSCSKNGHSPWEMMRNCPL